MLQWLTNATSIFRLNLQSRPAPEFSGRVFPRVLTVLNVCNEMRAARGPSQISVKEGNFAMALFRRIEHAVRTGIRGRLRSGTVTAAVLFSVMAIAQLVRFLLDVKVVANGVSIPTWPSIVAFIVFAVMATWLWRERRC